MSKKQKVGNIQQQKAKKPTARRHGWGKRTPDRRAFKVFKEIQAGGFPSVKDIAERLNIPPRSVERDIEMLRDRGVAIVYVPDKWGYQLAEPLERFPGVQMTEREIFALLISNKAAEHYQGTEFQEHLDSGLHKIMEYLDDEERIMFEGLDEAVESRPFGAEHADLKIFEQITLAIRKKRALRFPYKKPGSKTYEMREVLPYKLLKTNQRWYLIGPYVGSVDVNPEFLKKPFPYKLMRKFVLGRIREPELLLIKFSVPANFSLVEYLKGAFIIKTGTGDYHVELETNAYLTDILGDRHLHNSQKWTHHEDGSALLSLHLNCLDEIEEFVLSYGTDIVARGPQELRDRLYKKVVALEKMYRPQSNAENLKSGNAGMQLPVIHNPPSAAAGATFNFADGI